MGIRFPCHACNKRLNVKAFLAGKRGICPHCGTKVEIPWQSVSADGNGEEGPEISAIVPQSVSSGRASNGSANANAAAIPVAGTAAPAQTTAPGAVPKIPNTAPATPIQPGSDPMPAANGQVSMPVAQATVAPPQPPAVETPPDPIDEAPSAVWYVRPPSGGQYGPASGEIMRKWIDEGRVSADSLVWREGWADWKSADSLFVKLAGDTQTAAPATDSRNAPTIGTAGPTAMPDSGAPRAYTRRRSNSSLAVIIVVLLTLASVALIGVLIAVIQLMQ